MQNLIQLEDDVKGLPDQALQQLAQTPNPQVPQFLVISEIQRRGDMRKRFEARQQQQPQGTVAQQIVNPQPQGIASMMPQQGMPQGGPMPMPQGGPMPQPPMGQPMPQAPTQQPMQQPMPPQGMAAGGVIRMAEGRMATFPINQAPEQSSIIGQRINNPFNIRQYNQGFVGETGAEDGFISFEDPMYGVRAADKVLTTYGRDRDIDSIRGLVSRFAPPSENETQSYIDYISGQLGIDADAEIDLSDPAMRSRILAPMAKIESRTEYTPDQITAMIEQANLRQGESGATQFPTPTPNIQMPMPAGPDMDAPRERATKTTTEFLPIPPQTPSELMTGIFGGRETPEVGDIIRQTRVSTLPELENALPLVARQPTRKQAETGDVIRMAENTKVDPKGLITTDNNPVSAIIEDAAKGEIPPTTDISGSLDILRQSRGAAGDPGSAVTDRLNYLMGGAKNLESRTDEISGLGLPEYGTREYHRQVAEMVKDFQVDPATAERMAQERLAAQPKPDRRRGSTRRRKKADPSFFDTGPAGDPRGRNLKAAQLREERLEAERLAKEAKEAKDGAAVAGTDDATTKAAEAAVAETSAPDQEAAQQAADRYIQEARAAREAGLMSKEELAKKEALGAALIQLGAGIAKGDLAEGLSKAGVAAQDVREKARDRALRAKYYDSLADRSSKTSMSLEQKRIVETAESLLEGATGPDGKPLFVGSPEYTARKNQIIQRLAEEAGIDMTAALATSEDPTVSAAEAATPSSATSRYVIN